MKYLLLLISFNVFAGHEFESKYLRINQDLFGTISFPMDAAGVGYSYSTDYGTGIRLDVARSTETANSLYVEGLDYANKINLMTGVTVFQRFNVSDKWSIQTGVGKTDYKSTWWVNGIKPSWSDGTDSDWSYHARLYYKLKDVSLFIGYSDLYRKEKEGKGREETKAFIAGISYVF